MKNAEKAATCINTTILAYNDFLGDGVDAQDAIVTLVGMVEGCLRVLAPERTKEDAEGLVSNLADTLAEELLKYV